MQRDKLPKRRTEFLNSDCFPNFCRRPGRNSRSDAVAGQVISRTGVISSRMKTIQVFSQSGLRPGGFEILGSGARYFLRSRAVCAAALDEYLKLEEEVFEKYSLKHFGANREEKASTKKKEKASTASASSGIEQAAK